MRELKFRGWCEGSYKYDIVVIDETNFMDCFDGWIFKGEVEQYTGLKDKNGKEIYEGDIMKLYNGRRLVSTCIVSYDELNGEYIWNSNLDNTPLYGGFPVWAKYLVVGNIHENPELLGGEE